MNYYNEFSPEAAAWLRQLIEEKLIPAGIVDTRSICDVTPADLLGFTQCHFFAGIGGWPLALQRAGVSPDTELWTGSCPCQPFSSAGRQEGTSDERHLWPVFARLIAQCRPPIVIGEQVDSAIGHGWLDGVSIDLEVEGYAVGAAVLPACGIGAPHRRNRLWWAGVLAHTGSAEPHRAECATEGGREQCADIRRARAVADTQVKRSGEGQQDGSRSHCGGCTEQGAVCVCGGDGRAVADEHRQQRNGCRQLPAGNAEPANGGDACRMADAIGAGQCRGDERGSDSRRQQVGEYQVGQGAPNESCDGCEAVGSVVNAEGGGTGGIMGSKVSANRQACSGGEYERLRRDEQPPAGHVAVHCADGKYRRVPVESLLQRVDDGLSLDLDRMRDPRNGYPLCEKKAVPHRRQLLHGYGNAIHPDIAAVWVRVVMV